MNDSRGLDFLRILDAEVLFHLAGPFTSVHQEHQMIPGAIDKLRIKLVPLSQWMDNADLTSDDIRMSLCLLKHPSVCLSQGLYGQLKGPPRPAMDRKMGTSADDHGPSYSVTNSRLSSAIYQTAFLDHSPRQTLPSEQYYGLLSARRA